MNVPPLRRQVLVPCDPATAERLWTDELGAWWPIGSFGCFGEGAHVEFDGDTIVETSADGERAIWGTVTSRTSGALSYTWHPGRDASEATSVTVTFTPTGAEDLTLVTLVHTGWETIEARDDYAGGWIAVLDHFIRGAPADGQPDVADGVWFVLEHTAGPATPDEGVFSSPSFGHHIAFLRWLDDQGVLVAGGPLPDTKGAGMTVVRATDHETASTIVTAAQLQDGAVTSGLLDVRVRPWRVALSALPAVPATDTEDIHR
ncbi:MAG: SRPBCC domain-containing protein [Desertimonas sp.]